MTFEENPFRVLNVSIYADKATIIERADDLSFADPDREEIIEHARDILLNPRKRIAAEFWELIGDELVRDVGTAADIIAVDRKFSALNVKKICWLINTARKQSKFPEVQDTAAIRDELKNLRDEIRGMIQDTLKTMSHVERIKLANTLANGENFGVIVEDFFDSYRLQMTPFLDDTRKQIISLLNKIKINAHAQFTTELAAQVKAFADAMRPLDKFSEALGTNDFTATEKIFYTVRDAAIKLFNEKDLINDPLILTRTLEQNFSYLPHLAALIRKDIQFLEDAKARRPTQAFLDAKAALDTIQKAIDKHLHFEKGFESLNEAFYLYQFKPIYEKNLRKFILQGTLAGRLYKLDERKYLNSMAATIYLKVGNAMTWARRADLAFENFQKALPYAEASGDKELIALARKRVNEWKDIAQKVAARSNNDENYFALLFWIVIFGILYLLAR